ncbi:MAG: ExbD/TolR family protein [Allosphingosinicella sp.]|uniref:ExbD/TolR family protein n=1 Tax=Allosphingosinicella sp. TaxID=2823234 RepID=UPI00392F73BD
MPTIRARAPAFAAAEDAPMKELNTTPLIDVMLVLLIMFIITIPISTHQVPLDLPGTRPVSAPAAEPVVRRLDIDAAGAVRLDGRPMDARRLAAELAAIAAHPAAELHLRADAETRYERFDEVLAMVKRAGIARMGMIGNERFAEGL